MKLSIKRWQARLSLAALPAVLLGACLAGVTTAATSPPINDDPLNQLTEAEKKAGWKLLFDGKSMKGWHNYKKEGVRAGWQVKDGTLVCVDPAKAGDIVTDEEFSWFELSIEYNISEAGNSGIMFHVTNKGPQMWATGPEIQLEDNLKAKDTQRCGWIYGLYKPEIDPKTKKPLDTTKPVGEWNHIRVVIAAPPAKSEVDVNGTKYYDFVYGSDDWKGRIANSKFKSMANFAKSDTGYIGLQGDHGSIAFRNIKIRPIPIPAADTGASSPKKTPASR